MWSSPRKSKLWVWSLLSWDLICLSDRSQWRSVTMASKPTSTGTRWGNLQALLLKGMDWALSSLGMSLSLTNLFEMMQKIIEVESLSYTSSSESNPGSVTAALDQYQAALEWNPSGLLLEELVVLCSSYFPSQELSSLGVQINFNEPLYHQTRSAVLLQRMFWASRLQEGLWSRSRNIGSEAEFSSLLFSFQLLLAWIIEKDLFSPIKSSGFKGSQLGRFLWIVTSYTLWVVTCWELPGKLLKNARKHYCLLPHIN